MSSFLHQISFSAQYVYGKITGQGMKRPFPVDPVSEKNCCRPEHLPQTVRV